MSKVKTNELNRLLKEWGINKSKENFNDVLGEIMTGNSYVLIPTTPNNGELQISSIFIVDDKPVFLMFSDEASLDAWKTKGTEMQTTEMTTKEVLNFCEENALTKIVINAGQKNEFVMQKNS